VRLLVVRLFVGLLWARLKTMKYSPSVGGFYEDWRADLPSDCIDISEEDWRQLFEAQAQGAWIIHNGIGLPHAEFPPPPTLEQQTNALKAEIVVEVQNRLDTFARTREYDSMLSACTYANSSVAKFKLEGQYCVDARDATWSRLYAILAEVQAGTRPMPSGFADIESALPVLAWPG